MKIIINHSSMVPIYEQLIEQIKAMILNEELKADDSLPLYGPLQRSWKISALTVKKPMTTWRKKGLPLRFMARNLCGGRPTRRQKLEQTEEGN